MFFAILALALCGISYASDFTVVTNPSTYGTYYCPDGYEELDLDWRNRRHWTLGQWGSDDNTMCAIKDTQANCFKPNGKLRYWMTFLYGYGEYTIAKFDDFSFGDSYPYSTSVTGYTTSKSSTGFSNTLIPVYFTVRAIYFRVRGAKQIEVFFDGPTKRTIYIGEEALDYRKVTWICIEWRDNPPFISVSFKFHFDVKRKMKFWDLFMVSCCEILTDIIGVGKK